VTNFLNEIIELLIHPTKVKQFITEQHIDSMQINIRDIYDSCFPLASQLVVQRKQREIDSLNSNGQYTRFAIDYYGLSTLNLNFFPIKIKIFYGKISVDKIYQDLAHLDAS
jgi:hypothetical protein